MRLDDRQIQGTPDTQRPSRAFPPSTQFVTIREIRVDRISGDTEKLLLGEDWGEGKLFSQF